MTKRPFKAPFILTAALLLLALIPTMPYGYYGVMRWIVCVAFAYLAIQARETGFQNWMWGWAVAAGVYNPFFKVAATREVWTVVNQITLVAMGYGYWKLTGRTSA